MVGFEDYGSLVEVSAVSGSAGGLEGGHGAR